MLLAVVLLLSSRQAPSRRVDGDVVHLRDIVKAATAEARTAIAAPALRQVDIEWPARRYTLRFTDAAVTSEIDVSGTEAAALQVESVPCSFYCAGGPAYVVSAMEDLASLRVGPREAVRMVERHINGVEVRSLTLHLRDGVPQWAVFASIRGGIVRCDVDALLARFEMKYRGFGPFGPACAGPAQPPPVATPG